MTNRDHIDRIRTVFANARDENLMLKRKKKLERYLIIQSENYSGDLVEAGLYDYYNKKWIVVRLRTAKTEQILRELENFVVSDPEATVRKV